MVKGKITVLMSLFNCEDTLQTAIDSLLSQTYKNWQAIVCDDCSTDGTLELIKKNEAKHPNKFLIIRNETNLRLAASLNRCLQYADGEYCARMDGDDYIDPQRFEKQIHFLQTHPTIQLVGTEMQVFTEQNKLGRVIEYEEFPNKYSLRKGPCFAHATIMMYTGVYKALNGYTVSKRTKRSQDYDLWFRFFAAGFQGATIQEPLYFVREDRNAFLRRKPSLYLWAIITRWKGFRLLHYPIYYYFYVLSPLVGLIGNELRKAKVRFFKN